MHFRSLLKECPQCYCGEIRQMVTFHISLHCLKAYHRPGHSIRIVEYHSENLLFPNPTSSPGLEPRTVIGFVIFAAAFSPPQQTILLLVLSPYRS
jgi:hypothetical protein